MAIFVLRKRHKVNVIRSLHLRHKRDIKDYCTERNVKDHRARGHTCRPCAITIRIAALGYVTLSNFLKCLLNGGEGKALPPLCPAT